MRTNRETKGGGGTVGWKYGQIRETDSVMQEGKVANYKKDRKEEKKNKGRRK